MKEQDQAGKGQIIPVEPALARTYTSGPEENKPNSIETQNDLYT